MMLTRDQFLGTPNIVDHVDVNPEDLVGRAPTVPFMGKYKAKYAVGRVSVYDGSNLIASYFSGRAGGCVSMLAVDAPFRRQGIASEMIFQSLNRDVVQPYAKERTASGQAAYAKGWDRFSALSVADR